MKKYILLVSLAIVLSLWIAYSNTVSTIVFNEGIKYKGRVCVNYKDVDTGTWEELGCSINLITNIGKEFVEDQLTNPQTANTTKYISLSNTSTSPSASWTKLPDEFTSLGLSRAECTITDMGTGHFNCTHTFTATGSANNVQVAGLNWNSTSDSDGNLFAAATFTSVNLEANDQLQVTWEITIS